MSNSADANPLRGRHIFAADGNATETKAIQAVLSAAGATVDLFTDGRILLQRSAAVGPDVIVLDTVPRLDVGEIVRVLARHPKTAASAIVLLVPADLNPRLQRMYAQLGVFGILTRPLTCAAIREQLAAAATFADKAKADAEAELNFAAPGIVPGCDALLRRNLTCPFHAFGVEVAHYQLRAGKLASEVDVFDVPTYTPTTRDGDAIDYNLVAVSVCPECFFATSDVEQMGDDLEIDNRTLSKVAQSAGLRGLAVHDALKGEPRASFFTHERTPQEAVAAYAVAAMSSQVLYESSPVRRSIELLRTVNHHLRRANILQQHLRRPADALAARREAATFAQRAFAECKGAAMYRAGYQAMALRIHLGDDAAAFGYLAAFKDERKLAHRDQQDPATLERYLRRTTRLWEDRDLHRADAHGTLASNRAAA